MDKSTILKLADHYGFVKKSEGKVVFIYEGSEEGGLCGFVKDIEEYVKRNNQQIIGNSNTKKTIHKYLMPFAERAVMQLPCGTEVIRIDGIDGHLYMWAIVDTEAPMEDREFFLFKTGSEMPNTEMKYLGCGAIFIQMELMLYVFEEQK